MRPPGIDYHCVVYYQLGKVSQNVSFNVKGGKSGYNLTDLPVEVIDNVSLVTVLAAVYDNPVRPIAYLPSAVIGPVTPSVLTTSTILLYILLISVSTVIAESPEVVVSGEGSGVAGTSYTLTCGVSLPIGVQEASPNIQWKRPNMLLSSSSSITNTSRGFLATFQLQSLQSTDEGEYICLAGYYLGNIASPLVMSSTTLHVIGKSVIATYISLCSVMEPTLLLY